MISDFYGDAYVSWKAIQQYLRRIRHEKPQLLRRHVAERISQAPEYRPLSTGGYYVSVPATDAHPAFDATVVDAPARAGALPIISEIFEPGTFAVPLKAGAALTSWPYLTLDQRARETAGVDERPPGDSLQPAAAPHSGRAEGPPVETPTGGDQ